MAERLVHVELWSETSRVAAPIPHRTRSRFEALPPHATKTFTCSLFLKPPPQALSPTLPKRTKKKSWTALYKLLLPPPLPLLLHHLPPYALGGARGARARPNFWHFFSLHGTCFFFQRVLGSIRGLVEDWEVLGEGRLVGSWGGWKRSSHRPG